MSNTPEYRKIFPSYVREDIWKVNQIIEIDNIMDKKEVGFTKGVPSEEGLEDPAEIYKWIDKNMKGCSCLILFVGKTTYQSKYVKYEIELARDKGIGYFIIYLEGMLDNDSNPAPRGKDPYLHHGLYSSDGSGYIVKPYTWKNEEEPQYEIRGWIEDAIARTK